MRDDLCRIEIWIAKGNIFKGFNGFTVTAR